jgi:hypothetical protein
MTENASLSDYLLELRHGTTPERLAAATGIGALSALVGLYLGPSFAGLTGLGLAVAGVCAWARLNQIADSKMDGRFDSRPPASARQLHWVGVLALGIGAIGGLLFFYSIAFRFVKITKGM